MGQVYDCRSLSTGLMSAGAAEAVTKEPPRMHEREPRASAEIPIERPVLRQWAFRPSSQSGDWLYKYVAMERFLDIVLSTPRALRFSPVKDMNDPRDSEPFEFGLTASGEPLDEVRIDAPEQRKEINAEANRRLTDRARLGCFTADSPEASNRPSGSWLRGWNHSRMWTQYASGHKGVCLVFNRPELEARVRAQASAYGDQIWSGPVEYRDRLRSDDFLARTLNLNEANSKGWDAYIAELLALHHRSLFFVKNSDWASECEYRYLLVGSGPSPTEINVDSSLVAIILGSEFPVKRYYNTLRSLLPEDVRLLGMWWREHGPTLGELVPDGDKLLLKAPY